MAKPWHHGTRLVLFTPFQVESPQSLFIQRLFSPPPNASLSSPSRVLEDLLLPTLTLTQQQWLERVELLQIEHSTAVSFARLAISNEGSRGRDQRDRGPRARGAQGQGHRKAAQRLSQEGSCERQARGRRGSGGGSRRSSRWSLSQGQAREVEHLGSRRGIRLEQKLWEMKYSLLYFVPH